MEEDAPQSRNARVEPSVTGRWIVICADDPTLAWSGSRWVPHDQGLPVGGVQIANLPTPRDAQDFAELHGLVIVPIQ